MRAACGGNIHSVLFVATIVLPPTWLATAWAAGDDHHVNDRQTTPVEQTISPEALKLHLQEIDETLALSAKIAPRSELPASAEEYTPPPPGEENLPESPP
jgi:hypothetical protein